jgi:hypothetical protein
VVQSSTLGLIAGFNFVGAKHACDEHAYFAGSMPRRFIVGTWEERCALHIDYLDACASENRPEFDFFIFQQLILTKIHVYDC